MVRIFETCFDDTLRHLSVVEKLPHLHRDPLRRISLRYYQSELRFYRMFLWCIPDCDPDLLADFNFIATSIAQLYEFSQGTDSFALTDIAQYTSLAAEIIDVFIACQAEINMFNREHLISSCSWKDEVFTSKETMDFLDSIHVTVNDLLNMFPTEKNLKPLGELVLLFRDLVCYTPMAMGGEINDDQGLNVHDWANNTACMLLLYWLAATEDKFSISLLLDFQIIDPCNLFFIKECFEYIKVPTMKRADRILFGEFVFSFVDFFLENLIFILEDDVQMVREGLIFIITFLADPPDNTMNDDSDDLIPLVRERIYAVLDLASDNMCFYSENNMDLARGKTILDDFLECIDEVRGDIVNLYVQIPPSPWTDFPRIDRFGYFEGLLSYLENLKETMNNNKKLVPFLKHQIFKIHAELFPLRSFLQDTMAMHNEHNGLKDILEQIISVSYQVDFAIKSSFFNDNAVWHNLSCLSFFIRKIKDIQYKVTEFEIQAEGSHICRTESILPLMSSIDMPKPYSSTVEVVVGFNQEIEGLMDRLKWGSAKLDIISIVGMGGIGKTTLAKKLYNEPSVKLHFHKRAFCTVSQVYKKRKLLLDILRDISVIDEEIQQMSVEDLPLKVYQRLKGFKYLIVVDDIWDINVWDDLRHSFPDDHNGSRILFTTRIGIISLTARPDSIPCHVPFLSDEESWELLQQRVFATDPCPPNLLNVGKLIAEKCKGLPLSIVVIAGLLAKTERSLPQWNEVAESLSSFASNEGCRDIIKLSYMHLPETLKSCFLYLGAFSEDYKFDASTLALLWAAEGFVLKSGKKCLHKIGKRYLNDLSDRNLVTVTGRTYNGGIKRYHVHELIRDFCRSKAQEEDYMCYINAHNKNLPMPSVLYHYRICIEVDWRSFVDAKPRGPMVHSLLYFPDYLLPFSKAYTEVNSLQPFLSNFKLVEVLDLREVEISGEFPMTVTTLVHLRHLGLRFSGSVYVPPDIRNLWNLETLVLWGYEYSVRHVSPMLDWVNNRMITNLYEVIEKKKKNLYEVSFPTDIWKMIRLTHVEAVHMAYVATSTTHDATPLPDLKSFATLCIPPKEEGEKLLRRLSNVRKFSCICHAWWDEDRECNQLPKLEILTELETLCMALTRNSRPPFMYSFPTTIRKLTLVSDNLPWNDLSVIIGMLPCLEVLVLSEILVGGKRWDVEDDEFPSIKSLTLQDLDIEEWNASIDSFPCLEILSVFWCHSLVEIPPCFSDTATLKCIKVYYCEKSVADSAIQIQKDQVDSGNESFELVLLGIEP